jgi:hypothetical protein
VRVTNRSILPAAGWRTASSNTVTAQQAQPLVGPVMGNVIEKAPLSENAMAQ